MNVYLAYCKKQLNLALKENRKSAIKVWRERIAEINGDI